MPLKQPRRRVTLCLPTAGRSPSVNTQEILNEKSICVLYLTSLIRMYMRLNIVKTCSDGEPGEDDGEKGVGKVMVVPSCSPSRPHSSLLVKYLKPLAARRSAFSCFLTCHGSLVVMLVTKQQPGRRQW